MRKQILAGLMAAVALLFSVVAVTGAPASGDDLYYSSYAAYPAEGAKGGFATKTESSVGQGQSSVISLPAGTAQPGTMATLFANDEGAIATAVVNPDGSVIMVFTVPLTASLGEHIFTIEFTAADGTTYAVQHVITVTAAPVVTPPTTTPPVVSPPVVNPPVVLPPVSVPPVTLRAPILAPVVTTAVNYGFGDTLPAVDDKKATALAHTGSESSVLGFIATGLIAAGAIVMGSRRTFLED